MPPYPSFITSSSPPPPSDLILESNGPSEVLPQEAEARTSLLPPLVPPRITSPSASPPPMYSLSDTRNGQIPPHASDLLLESNGHSASPPPETVARAPQLAPPRMHPLSS